MCIFNCLLNKIVEHMSIKFTLWKIPLRLWNDLIVISNFSRLAHMLAQHILQTQSQLINDHIPCVLFISVAYFYQND